jgi:hypothetical protein
MKTPIVIIIVLSLFGISNLSLAQSSSGEKTANLGLSLGYGLGINAALDINVAPNISVGGVGSFSNRSFDFGVNYSVYSIGARGAYHLAEILSEPLGIDPDRNDPYIGIGLIYTGVAASDFLGTFGGVRFAGVAGYRYFFKEKLGIYAEGGFPLSSIGLTLKL